MFADLKTFAAMGVYGMASITALTIQSTLGVRKVIGLDHQAIAVTVSFSEADD